MLREMYNRNYLTDVFGSVHIVFTAIPLLDLLYPWIALQMNELVIYRVARPNPSLPSRPIMGPGFMRVAFPLTLFEFSWTEKKESGMFS